MKTLFRILSISIVLCLALSLNSCLKDNGSNSEYPDVTATADTIHGVMKYYKLISGKDSVVNWPFGAATFKVIAGVRDVIASAPVNSDGSFTLILPSVVKGQYMNSLAEIATLQGGTLEASPTTTRILSVIQYRVDYNDNGTSLSINTNLYTLKADYSINKSYFYNFYDSNGTFTGTSTNGNVFNWTFTKGWGMVESTKINSSSSAFNSKSIEEAPAGAVWVNL